MANKDDWWKRAHTDCDAELAALRARLAESEAREQALREALKLAQTALLDTVGRLVDGGDEPSLPLKPYQTVATRGRLLDAAEALDQWLLAAAQAATAKENE